MKNYHAHIYFAPHYFDKANELYKKALSKSEFSFCKIYDRPIGPHPLAMIEVHFKEDCLDECRNWFETNRNSLSILIHIDTGDDIKDHSENIEWLGTPLKIDFSFFDLIKSRPDLKVHQD